jgi:prephenate dehydratase
MSPDGAPVDKAGARERPRVAYLGPAGTFTEEALLAGVWPDTVEPVAARTIYETILALRRRDVELSIVPIENSLDGSITVTLDLLADEQADLEIVGEELLTVRHSLIAAHRVELAEIDTVITHPQVPGQCERFLRGELGRARVLAASSTAEAVRATVSAGRRNEAALGTVLAAEIYGGVVLREGVQDRDDNETRFAWLARSQTGGRAADSDASGGAHQAVASLRFAHGDGEEWKTSLVFWGPGADSPGWLVRCLDEFSRRQINLTKIESRPKRERMGHYMFFVDLQGSVRDETVAQALEGLDAICEEARVLGSYRAIATAVPAAGQAAAAIHSATSDG